MDKYDYQADELFLKIRFESSGPKGIIKKIVVFNQIINNVYSIGFGDVSESEEVDDKVVSNNGDSFKILVTVASIITDFTKKYDHATLVLKGSTDARSRLYQININKYWDVIESEFIVLGLLEKHWRPFQKGNNYTAFMIYRKTN